MERLGLTGDGTGLGIGQEDEGVPAVLGLVGLIGAVGSILPVEGLAIVEWELLDIFLCRRVGITRNALRIPGVPAVTGGGHVVLTEDTYRV